MARHRQWAAAVKLELPLTGTYAYLLNEAPADWLEQQRLVIVERLRGAEPLWDFEILTGWSTTLAKAPLPLALISHIYQLTRPDRFGLQYLRLRDGGQQVASPSGE